jgi:hypothetical protein
MSKYYDEYYDPDERYANIEGGRMNCGTKAAMNMIGFLRKKYGDSLGAAVDMFEATVVDRDGLLAEQIRREEWDKLQSAVCIK